MFTDALIFAIIAVMFVTVVYLTLAEFGLAVMAYFRRRK
jgi:hypothetical protein